ncbi:MAG TPA: hypothetical protein VMH28_05140 [Candidatus Acidoferrales bacterium]|nr:hypothetical protein [Candidatus Acidoferrales bacterium]
MKAPLIAVAVPVNTLLLTSALLWIDPFARTNSLLDAAFGAAPKWTQVANLFRSPLTQDIHHGEHPVTSFQGVADHWRARPGWRVVLIGNSQMFSLSLAPGEVRQSAPEYTYPDLVTERLQPEGILTYRLAAPGLSYSEALCEVDYLLIHPELRPALIVLQVNYQAFWNSGIRESLVELFGDRDFRRQAQQRAQSGKPYADDFASALAKCEQKYSRSGSQKPPPQNGFGSLLENFTRRELSAVDVYRRHHEAKDSFEEMLYRARTYFLRIKPSGARSILGPQLTRSQAALEAIAASCRAAGVRLAIFMAPVNPAVSLYRSAEDRLRYQGFVRTIAERYGLPMLDLESSVADKLWGRQLDGPDPLHMGRTAHAVVAGRVAPFIQVVLEGHWACN